MSEIELKLLIGAAEAKRLWARARASGLVAGVPTVRRLRSIYFDTAEHALREAGIALRLRRDGRKWVQTVKSGRQSTNGLSRSEELENAAPGGRIDLDAIADPAIRDEIVRRVDGGALAPVCETAIRRSSGMVKLADGTRAELCVDTGDIHAAGRKARLEEVEIELIDGKPAALFDIARALFPDGGLRFSRLSKSARGYLLAEAGYIEPELAPRNAGAVAIEPDQTAEVAARNVLRECVEQVSANIVATVGLDDPEGPHQLRVGLRRLRSAFALFETAIGSAEATRLAAEARWLGQEVGALRDLDVAAAEIARPEADAHPDEPALAALAEMLDRAAASRRMQLGRVLVEERSQSLILDLVRFVETRGWFDAGDIGQTDRLAAPVTGLSGEALDRCWKKVRKRARRLETLDTAERHELRKALKKLRYAAEFLAPLYPEDRVARFLKRLKRLQTVFGELNDAAMVRTLLADPALSGSSASADGRAAGWLVGATQARAEHAWTRARALWRELRATRPFWR